MLALLCMAACARESPQKGFDEPLPAIRVSIDRAAAGAVRIDTVSAVLERRVTFSSFGEPDPGHFFPVVAKGWGELQSVRSAGHVSLGDTLAVIQDSRRTPRPAATSIVAAHDGFWAPQRLKGQSVWDGSNLGRVQEHGFMIARVQMVDGEARFIHVGDSALVSVSPHLPPARGIVQSVFASRPYYSDVVVHFRVSPDTVAPNTPVSVTINHMNARDTVASALASAVVTLPIGGAAVFVPVSDGVFQVRWVWAVPADGGRVLLRSGIERGSRIAASGIEALAAAARDSLSRIGPK